MQGKIIVIEGLDGSGKATQAEILYNTLLKQGVNVKKLTFPCYDSDSSALVRMYLNGELGDEPDAVNPYACAAFYAADRVASYLSSWKKDYDSGVLFICDRYSTSNPLYHISKLPKSEYRDYLDWVNDFEHNKLGIPKPDAVIYLDMPTEISQRLMSKRYSGNDSKKDLHEKNKQFLDRCRSSAKFCADSLGWHVISCAENGEPRSIEAVAKEIYEFLSGIKIC